MSGVETHRDRTLGFELDVPVGASVLDVSEHGVVVELAGGGGANCARVVVTVEPADRGVALEALVSRALSRGAAGAGLIDRQRCRLSGVAAERTLCHRAVESTGITVEEWRALRFGRLVTVSAACASASYEVHREACAALVAGLRLIQPEPLGASPATSFDPTNGQLVAGEAAFEALRSAARREPLNASAASQAQALTDCGALVAGRPHPALERVLAPTLAPVLELAVSRDDVVARGWADDRDASLLIPLSGGELRRLAGVPVTLLPGVLAGMLGVGPRPGPAEREPVELESGQLGRLIAGERGQRAAEGQGAADSPEPPEAAAVVAGLRDHWRIDARWVEDGRAEMLEAIDAARGLWLVMPRREGGARLEPTCATEVWRHLTGLIPTSVEMPGR